MRNGKRAARPLLLLDEVRPDGPGTFGQFTFFVAARTDTRTAVQWMRTAAKVREGLPEQSAKASFKGSKLYGSSRSGVHRSLREYLAACRAQLVGISVLGTTAAAVSRIAARTTGGIRTRPARGERRPASDVRGRELPLLLSYLKRTANDAGLRGQVDLLVDRSRQFGLGVRDRGLANNEFETFGPGPLNRLAGGRKSSIRCNCKFRIIPASDKSPFRDLLLIPDALAYVGAHRGNTFDAAKLRLQNGEETWVWTPGLGEFNFE